MFENLHWIGAAPSEYERTKSQPGTHIVAAFFSLEADVEAVPEKLAIQITGRSQYKLFVNGEPVIFGPLRSRAEQAVVDEPDIAPWLKSGKNRITVQAMSYPSHPVSKKHEGPSNCYADDSGPGIAVSGMIGNTDMSLAVNWKALIDDSMDFDDYFAFLAGPTEKVDLGRRGELAECLADAPCPVYLEESSANFTGERLGRRFEKRLIPPLYRKERFYADNWDTDEKGSISKEAAAEISSAKTKEAVFRRIAPQSTLHFVVDAGELTTAYPHFVFSGGKGSRVRITYAECFTVYGEGWNPEKRIRDDRTGFLNGCYDELTVSGNDETYEPFRFRTFRFMRIDVETAEEALEITLPSCTETAYPLVNDKRPAFSDAKKEKLYDVALRTLQLCMHDTYEDCPYYEQLQYASDSRLEMLFTYSCSTDTRLQENGIRLFASSLLPEGLTQARFPSQKLQVITGFALYFVLMLEDYIRETGNAEKMERYMPVAEQIIENFLRNRTDTGLIAAQGFDRGYWEYWDWTDEWNRSGTPNAILERGVSTLENLVFIYTVQSLSRILPLYHRSDLAKRYADEAKELKKLVKEQCWDAQKGLFAEAPGFPEYSQHSQIFAVLTDLVSGNAAKELMEKVLTDKSLVQCSFVQRFYLFRALEKAGMYERTEALWEDWQHMIDLHCTTFPETPTWPRSECHAWSALPLYEFRTDRKQR